jgi:tetratricopeptide (TPR) repeat protein
VSGNWPRSYRDLPPDAQCVARALVLLEMPTMAADDLAAAVSLDTSSIANAVEACEQADWIRADALALDEAARQWLAEALPTMTTAAEQTGIATRFAAYQTAGLTVDGQSDLLAARWADEHRGGIVAAIRAATASGLYATAVDVALRAWRVADRVPDRSWWHDLARHGEDAATRGRDPHSLFALLASSAVVFAQAGDEVTAERQWVRAVRLSDDDEDYDRTVQALTALAGLYQSWGRLDKALDTWVDLVDEHQRAGNVIATAHALAEVGFAMLAADRAADAPTYLSRADELLSEAKPALVSASAHARVLEAWGHALWQTGQHGAARRRLSRALAMVVDHDDPTAERIRAALATETGRPLPNAERPGGATNSAVTEEVQHSGN